MTKDAITILDEYGHIDDKAIKRAYEAFEAQRKNPRSKILAASKLKTTGKFYDSTIP